MTNLTPQQSNALALIRDGASDTEVAEAGIVSSAKTIRRWRSSNPAWREAEADALGSVAEVLGAEGIRAIQRLSELSQTADDRAAVSAATTLASLLERRDARKQVVSGGPRAAVIVVSRDEAEFLRKGKCPACGHADQARDIPRNADGTPWENPLALPAGNLHTVGSSTN